MILALSFDRTLLHLRKVKSLIIIVSYGIMI